MNPPLRSSRAQERMLEFVLDGKIDIIGTDHAPHPVVRKDCNVSPASGIPALPFWPKAIKLLRELGILQKTLDNITFHKANELFKLGLQPKMVITEYNPARWEKYGYNPFSGYGN